MNNILSMAQMNNCKPMRTTLTLHHSLYEDQKDITAEDHQSVKHIPYRELVGSLLYLSTRTAPDISTAVFLLGKFTARPGKKQWSDLQHLIRYVKGTLHHRLSLKRDDSSNVLESWCDAYWARDYGNRRSRTGIIITFNGNPILWKSKLQTTTALSTADE